MWFLGGSLIGAFLALLGIGWWACWLITGSFPRGG